MEQGNVEEGDDVVDVIVDHDVRNGDAAFEIVHAAKRPPSKVKVFSVAEEHDQGVLAVVNMGRIEGGPSRENGGQLLRVDIGANQSADIAAAAIAKPGLDRNIVRARRKREFGFGTALPVSP